MNREAAGKGQAGPSVPARGYDTGLREGGAGSYWKPGTDVPRLPGRSCVSQKRDTGPRAPSPRGRGVPAHPDSLSPSPPGPPLAKRSRRPGGEGARGQSTSQPPGAQAVHLEWWAGDTQQRHFASEFCFVQDELWCPSPH